jgi:hypothetical protein
MNGPPFTHPEPYPYMQIKFISTIMILPTEDSDLDRASASAGVAALVVARDTSTALGASVVSHFFPMLVVFALAGIR